MKYYIEIGSRVDDVQLSERMKSWTGWEHADVVVTVHIPDADITQAASGTHKSFSKALEWLVEKVQRHWPEDV